jgi:hypothetical protein
MLMHALNELLSDHQIYHSDLQIDSFITTKTGGTKYGMYKQALRELDARVHNLRSLYLQRAAMLESLEKLRKRRGWRWWFLSPLKKKLILVQAECSFDDMERNIAEVEREFRRFYAIASSLKDEIGELTPERRAELDEDLWRHNAKKAAALDIMSTGRVGRSTIEMIQCLPPPMRQGIWGETARSGELVKWFMDYEHALPVPRIEGNGDVRKLIEQA